MNSVAGEEREDRSSVHGPEDVTDSRAVSTSSAILEVENIVTWICSRDAIKRSSSLLFFFLSLFLSFYFSPSLSLRSVCVRETAIGAIVWEERSCVDPSAGINDAG